MSLTFSVSQLLMTFVCVVVGGVLVWADFGYTRVDGNNYWFEAVFSWWFSLPIVSCRN